MFSHKSENLSFTLISSDGNTSLAMIHNIPEDSLDDHVMEVVTADYAQNRDLLLQVLIL